MSNSSPSPRPVPPAQPVHPAHSEPNRVELDPPAGPTADPSPATGRALAAPAPGSPAAARAAARRLDDPSITRRLDDLIKEAGGVPNSFQANLVRELMNAALKLIPDGRDTGELKLITAAVKELRYAYRVFGQYREPHKVTIFGSARTPKDHPDYDVTVRFSRLMAQAGWMVITGAGGGIMEAGHVGPGREKSFGVAIRLPFETTANEVIAGDDKLIHFRYFFTRKLMFLSQAEAVALFPGGFGTMDEAYEALTLIQTGKSSMIPVVLLEGAGETYWERWEAWTRYLLTRQLISPEDLSLYCICREPEEAVRHIQQFYRIYHSSRYVGDDLVIRLKTPITQADADRLSERFAPLIRKGPDGKPGRMTLRGPYEVEEDHLDLPRLAFTHTRSRFGMVRQLIDAINECQPG